ncbi:MAG: hypothetical protein ACOCP8_01170 [archaeon]
MNKKIKWSQLNFWMKLGIVGGIIYVTISAIYLLILFFTFLSLIFVA